MMTTMSRRICVCLAMMLAPAFAALADQYNVGAITYDVTGTGTAEFDITNLTGPNALPPDFPIDSSVNLSSLSLTVHFSDGSTVVEPSSYFSLALDGLSWNGSSIGIGGVNPQPTSATLTGSFSPTSVDVAGVGTVDILPTFSVSFSDSPALVDGDFGLIVATSTTVSGVPEANSWFLLGTVIFLIAFARRNKGRAFLRSFRRTASVASAIALAALVCSLAVPQAQATTPVTVKLSSATTPSTGVAGVNNVNVTAGSWPAGDTTAANVIATWESSCGGAAVATDSANTVKTFVGSTERVNINIPASLATGTYYVQLSDTAGSDTDFTSGTSCSAVQVTGSSKTLAACVPASSLGVVAPVTGPAPVFAIAPNASWDYADTKGAQIVQIETGGGASVAPVSLPLPDYINSCAGNPATGEAVCVANDKNVYHIKGVGNTNTFTSLVSGASGFAGFSGGSCENCGVAVNANGNYAVINQGNSSSPSGSGLQTLNLATDTFLPPFAAAHEVSENIAIDPIRGVVLSADEGSNYDLVAIDATGNIGTEYGKYIGIGELDSSTEDCATGIALAPAEFTNTFVLADLTQATFTPGTPGSWTAPSTNVTIIGSYAAGLSGSAVAPGGQHLAVVTGEFGGSSFAVLKLPATSGSGAPVLQDYAYVCGVSGFSAGYDPHTLTAYVSPNDGKSYGLFANWPSILGPSSLLQADLAGILALPRSGDGHSVVGDSGCTLDPAGAVGSTVLKNVSTH